MTIDELQKKCSWIRKETLNIHKIAPSTRIASSLSPVEIFAALYYADILRFDSSNPRWTERDRFIISKAHGAVSMYPILADLGFFPMTQLATVAQQGSFLGGIPDSIVPGFETVNGSLGHGLGVACGVALALRTKGTDQNVLVLLGDGELYEGSVWEAIMFAAEHRLDHLVAIVDSNKISMLDYCVNILDLGPLREKFQAFKWEAEEVDGHDIGQITAALKRMTTERNGQPKLLIADTIKGKGVRALEHDSLCHLRTLSPEEVDAAIEDLP
jgi:transketolase